MSQISMMRGRMPAPGPRLSLQATNTKQTSQGHTHRSRHVQASAAAPVSISADSSSASAGGGTKPGVQVVCPVCLTTPFEVPSDTSQTPQLACSRCARTFAAERDFVDLTLSSGVAKSSYSEKFWAGTELFETSTVSQIYERGWRQGFSWAGFPGADTEFGYAMDYLRPQLGETIVDLSCGSGLFTRRFAACRDFAGVVAVDYSANMLKETANLVAKDRNLDSASIQLIRADVARLPFATGSVAAIHAGAAIHCWPNPTAALAEISRVLKPGGVFVGSTFLNGVAPLGQLLGNDEMLAPLVNFDPTTQLVNKQYKWWSEPELRDLFAGVGLQNFQRQRQNRFILFSATKPNADV